ncbi:MAG: response regulator transcription factor [Chloroflexota bacterium]|nr:response regulator transcription factor [Chloroflexota bacterium]
MSTKSIQVLVVDDHPIVISGTRALLEEVEGIEVIGEAHNGLMAIEKNKELKPDVILMDLIMPEMDGIEAIQLITEDQPDTRILVLTSFITDDKVFPAIKAGAMGFLLKDSEPEALIKAIRDVYKGEPSLAPDIARKVLREIGRQSADKPIPDPLTDREMEVLKLVSKGYDNQEIAEELVIAEVTVRTHVSRILRKLQLANRVQATLYALKKGLASLEDE